MTDSKSIKNDKSAELLKYRNLVLVTIDYYLDYNLMSTKKNDLDSGEHYQRLKMQTEEHFKKGRLTRLKQWFKDLTEMQIETGDLKFNIYLRKKTGYDIDIFKSYFERINKVILSGKITTDNQFYNINIMVDQLSRAEPIDIERIEILNKLLAGYEQRKNQRQSGKR